MKKKLKYEVLVDVSKIIVDGGARPNKYEIWTYEYCKEEHCYKLNPEIAFIYWHWLGNEDIWYWLDNEDIQIPKHIQISTRYGVRGTSSIKSLRRFSSISEARLAASIEGLLDLFVCKGKPLLKITFGEILKNWKRLA